MPYSENEKLQRFADEVISMAETERKRIVSEKEIRYKDLMAAGKEKIRNDALDYLAREINSLRQKSGQHLSQHSLKKQKELQLYREKIQKTVAEKLHARLDSFVKSPDYKVFLIDLCINILKKQNLSFVLYLSEGDMQYKKDLLSAVAAHPDLKEKIIDILPEKSICFGGIRFLSDSGRILINETLDERLKRQHEHLIKLVKPVYGSSDKEGSSV